MKYKNFLEEIVEESVEVVHNATGNKIEPIKPIQYPWDMFEYLQHLDEILKDGIYKSAELYVPEENKYNTEGVIIAADGVKILPFSQIRGPVILGRNVAIGGEVKNSIILSNTTSLHMPNYIGDSIIGRNCNFGCGTVTANVRFDDSEVGIMYDNTIHDTHRKKLGAIVENDCKFGTNSVIPPGTYIGEGTWWINNKPVKK